MRFITINLRLKSANREADKCTHYALRTRALVPVGQAGSQKAKAECYSYFPALMVVPGASSFTFIKACRFTFGTGIAEAQQTQFLKRFKKIEWF